MRSSSGIGKLDDRRAVALEDRDRGVERGADVGLEGRERLPAQDADAQAVDLAVGVEERVGERRAGERRHVLRVGPGEHREEQRRILDRSRQRAHVVERPAERERAGAADAAVRRLHAHEPAVRRGNADRAAGVGSDRPHHRAGRDGCRRAAARAARGCGRDPTGCASAVCRRRRRGRASPSCRRDRPGGSQPRDGGGVLDGRGGVRIRARAVAGRQAGDVEDVLDRDRDPPQRTAPAFVLGSRLAQRALGVDRDEGVQQRLDRRRAARAPRPRAPTVRARPRQSGPPPRRDRAPTAARRRPSRGHPGTNAFAGSTPSTSLGRRPRLRPPVERREQLGDGAHALGRRAEIRSPRRAPSRSPPSSARAPGTPRTSARRSRRSGPSPPRSGRDSGVRARQSSLRGRPRHQSGSPAAACRGRRRSTPRPSRASARPGTPGTRAPPGSGRRATRRSPSQPMSRRCSRAGPASAPRYASSSSGGSASQ